MDGWMDGWMDGQIDDYLYTINVKKLVGSCSN